MIVFELLTGRLPFEAQSVGQLIGMHLFKEPPRVRELAPSVPEALAERVQAMLAKEKAARPTMRELQREFERMLRAGTSEPGTEPPATPGPLAPTASPAASAPARSSEAGPGARGGSRLLLAAGALTLLGGAGALALRLRASPVVTEKPVPVVTHAADAGLAAAPPRARIRWSVTSQPAGATVLRAEDGQIMGKTPWEYEDLQAPGEARLLLRYDGFVEEPVTLPRDRDAAVQRRLHPIKLSLPAPTTPHAGAPPPRNRPGR
ncbi:MAG: hypothetical protein U1A78_26475 [Polyangia bacterium]